MYDIVKLEKISFLLAECSTVKEVKNIRDIAVAAKAYAKARGLGKEHIHYATGIKLESERKLGFMLKPMPKNKGEKGRFTGNTKAASPVAEAPTLKELGFTLKESSVFQLLATVSESDFQAIKRGEMTISDIKQEAKKQKRKAMIAQAKPVLNKDIEIIHADFKEVDIEKNSIDLILTDPPYPFEYLHLWDALGKLASKVLKPSGFLVAYSGQLYLDVVIRNLSKHALAWYWLAGLNHKGACAFRHERNVQNRMKPILIFQKPPVQKQNTAFEDLISSPAPSKQFHEWGQSVEPLEYLLEAFSKPGDLILDPMAGGGSTALACINKKRRCKLVEVEKENISIIESRLQ